MFIRFDVIHERDRRTDGQTYGQTLHDSIDRACIASRGKNAGLRWTNQTFKNMRQNLPLSKSLSSTIYHKSRFLWSMFGSCMSELYVWVWDCIGKFVVGVGDAEVRNFVASRSEKMNATACIIDGGHACWMSWELRKTNTAIIQRHSLRAPVSPAPCTIKENMAT